MALFKFFFTEEGLKEVNARLEKISKAIGPEGQRVLRKSIVVELLKAADKKLALSARGTLPKGWKPLSPMTVFIRNNRKSKPNKKARAGVDSGRMRSKNEPFETSRGKTFGIRNKLKRASLFNFGGISSASRIRIGRHTRNNRSGGRSSVRAFTLKMKGGRPVPARPFFPTKNSFLPMMRKILKDAEIQAARG